MTTTIGITNGTTTYNLNQVGGPYELIDQTWSPAVATRRRSTLGGGGMYADVEETFELLVRSSGGLTAAQHVAALRRLLDTVATWSDNDDAAAAVKLTFRPHNSVLFQDYDAVILEIISVELPPNYAATGNTIIYPVRITLRRQGAWRTYAESASSTAIEPGVVWSVTLPDHTEYSPVDVEWEIQTTGPSINQNWIFPGQAMVLSNTSSDLTVIDSAIFMAAPAGAWTAQSYASALGGTVARCAVAAGSSPTSGNLVMPPLQTAGRYLLIANCRSPNINSVFNLQLEVQYYDDSGTTLMQTDVKLPPVTYDATVSSPARALVLGMVTVPGANSIKWLTLYLTHTNVASVNFEIDYIVVARINPTLRVLLGRPMNTGTAPYGINTRVVQRILQRLRTKTSPIWIANNTSNSIGFAPGWTGAIDMMQLGTTYAGVWLGGQTGPVTEGTFRPVAQPHVVSSPVMTYQAIVTRQRNYLIPE